MALNPIAYTEKVVNNFLRYQLTAYPFADPVLYDQMRRLLSLEETRRTPLLKGPYVSLSRAFRAGATVRELVSEGIVHPLIESLHPYPRLHGHQERAIRSIATGKTTLVSTGTGSGKTETFLYPVVSRCLQLRDQDAPSGIAAVLVYPMNALAEDQLGRLRELLAGTGVPFGMYIGKTPEREADVPGQRLKAGASREDYRKAVERSRKDRRETAVHPFEERCSREDMRATGRQPRILLTNVKQLELLLTRQADVELFDGARLDFLVFDEAHTYGGTTGAETACLVRRLRAFCGKEPRDTVCIATSATIADPITGLEAGRNFAARFFGVAAQDVTVVGEEYEADVWSPSRSAPPPLSGDPQDHLREVLVALDSEDRAGQLVGQALEKVTGHRVSPRNWREELYDRLSANELAFQLAATLARPRPLAELLSELGRLVGRPVSEEEALFWLALGAAARKNDRPLLRPVVHAFVRGIGGAVVSFPDGEPGPHLWLSPEDEQASGGEGAERRLALLPITTCSTCGQHYYIQHVADFVFTGASPGGGEAIEDRRVWRPLDASRGGKRVVLLDRVIAAEDGDDDPDRTAEVFVCRSCGALHPGAVDRCDACGRAGRLVRLLAVAEKEESPGWLTRCVSCGTPGRRRGAGFREPARPVRAVNVSDVHVLAQDMLHHAERKRLLVFADNRQDAAFQAGWMRDHARRFRLRALMAERIALGPVSVGDLTAYLDEKLERDDELSRALVPEVWNVHRKEAEGVKHAEERKRYLRIQVLREITTGVKQRMGLEPWGRLRVDYAGLDERAPFVVRHAAALGLTPNMLANGIAGLLDRQRRALHVLDREGKIFSRFWQPGDFEVLRGYLPYLQGVPKALKLARQADDNGGRLTQWLSERGDTVVRQAARTWGVQKDHVAEFVRELWEFVTAGIGLLAPVTLTGSKGRALPRCSGAHQIDADKLRIAPTKGLWRCKKCRRSQIRPAPLDRCLAWRCDGTLAFVEEDPDNYDLGNLDAGFQMIRPREHSAQVPGDDREVLERLFKDEHTDIVNTLVCTPTLELGVDIGALDAVLMRNVPPLPANYWQRAGRAGRRQRMAVNITYARPTSHDRAYFADPAKILEGSVTPPRFNLRNELMVAKHVHAVVLTRLFQLARARSGLGEADRQVLVETLATVFPKQIKDYLFDETSAVRGAVFDVSRLGQVISRHETDILGQALSAFRQGWPTDAQELVTEERLLACIRGTAGELTRVLRSLKKRLDWALGQMRRLAEARLRKGTLDPDEDALFSRCDRLVKRYKGQRQRRRQEAEGYDDTNTWGVLAAEGFLPGYGLEVGAVLGTAQVPKHLAGAKDFELPRAPSVALREYVPGNLIYANGHKFIGRYFHLQAVEEPTVFQVDVACEAVVEVGLAAGQQGGIAAALGSTGLRAIPVCDVDLSHVSHITDEEDHRFQLPVATYGQERDRHDGGRAYRWGPREVQLRRGVHLRLVNVGANSLVETGRLGYPLCLVCGQSRSPFSSPTELQHFADDHLERCGRPVEQMGFFADVVGDALSLASCASRDEAYSLAEALRAGAARVLDMERDDLEILVVGRPGSQEADAILYDPMPGGSGLLEQACTRFDQVVEEAIKITEGCPSRCQRTCVDCLSTFWNAYFDRHLDRLLAAERLRACRGALVPGHEIPAKLPTAAPRGSELPVNEAEAILRDLLQRAGFAEPAWQHQLNLGRPLGTTTPDCFFAGEMPDEKGTCVYLDGLSAHIHGNAMTRAQDLAIRGSLKNQGYWVVEIAASDLSDRGAMANHFFKLGQILVGKERARDVKARADTWFVLREPASVPVPAARQPEPLGRDEVPFPRLLPRQDAEPYVRHLPVYDLKVAAGRFSGSSAEADERGWIEVERRPLDKNMFVCQVVGESMNRRIPNGSYCIFRSNVRGTRQGRVVLAKDRRIADLAHGGDFTVKVYESEKTQDEDGWKHTVIRLKPDTTALGFEPIELRDLEEDEVVVLAELVDVLPAPKLVSASAGAGEPPPVPPVRHPLAPADSDWDESLELLDPSWVPLARGLRREGIPAPDEVDWDIPIRGRVSGSRAIMMWRRQSRVIVLAEDGTECGDAAQVVRATTSSTAGSVAVAILQNLRAPS